MQAETFETLPTDPGDPLHAAMLLHAEQAAPRECCGLVVRSAVGAAPAYWPCRNLSPGTEPDRFELDPADYAAAEEAGEVLAVVHSHPNASANPSMADRVQCEKSGLPWLVIGWPSGVVKLLQPSGWQAPYKGREFHHGMIDCYTLIQDWFRRELAVVLPDFDRADGWWEADPERPGYTRQDLYMRHFAEAGFVRVFGEPQRHDGLLMQVKADVANHGAVYLGDGTMLHHLHGRLSEETVYGGYWQRHTVALVRHISRIEPANAFAVALQAAA